MRCIIVFSIIFGLIVCSTYVQARANGHQDQRHPISEASVGDDNEISSDEFEKFRRATVSVLLDSDSTETTDQLLMRAKLLAYVDKLKAKEAKKKLKAEAKAAKQKAFLAAFLPPVTTTTAPATTDATNDVTTHESSSSEEESVEVTTEAPKAARATFNVTVSDSAESSDDLLMRAKLVSYVEKLKAKAAKTKLKAQMKAEKDKAFIAMFLATQGITTPNPLPAGEAKRAVTAADSTAELLAQAKLDAYIAKLQAKQEKAKLKADKKAAKQAMFAQYLASAANASAFGSPAGTLPGVAPAPALPFPGAIGLWNKSMFLNGLFTAMASANAAAAAAAAATPAPPVVPVAPVAPAVVAAVAAPEAEEEETVTELSEISKRRAPSHHWDEESEEESVEESPEAEEVAPVVEDAPPAPVARYRPKQSPAYKAARPLSNRDQEILDFWAKYNKGAGIQSAERAEVIPSRRTDIGNRHKPGATNDFKTGPAGSPNGVGYAESPVSQAGCSGSHIHSCSGMTVYINKPEGDDDNETPKVVPVKDQSPKKHHHHKGGDKKKRALKAKRALNKVPAA